MIQVYTGDGKGKTTASTGLSLRAAGQGFKVLFIQFLKDGSSGEICILKGIPGIDVIHSSVNYGGISQMTAKQKQDASSEYARMMVSAIESDVFLIVLDEAINALNAGLIDQSMLERLFEKECEIVVTGRNAPLWLLERADYVTEFNKIRHPYDIGVQARIGIEY